MLRVHKLILFNLGWLLLFPYALAFDLAKESATHYNKYMASYIPNLGYKDGTSFLNYLQFALILCSLIVLPILIIASIERAKKALQDKRRTEAAMYLILMVVDSIIAVLLFASIPGASYM